MLNLKYFLNEAIAEVSEVAKLKWRHRSEGVEGQHVIRSAKVGGGDRREELGTQITREQ